MKRLFTAILSLFLLSALLSFALTACLDGTPAKTGTESITDKSDPATATAQETPVPGTLSPGTSSTSAPATGTVETPGSVTAVPDDPPKVVTDDTPLLISEIMSDNTRFPVGGVVCDFIELFNAGESDIELSDYYASDKENKPFLSRLPEAVLEPGGYALLRCGYELDFNLGKDGETVTLTRKDGALCRSVTFGRIGKNKSLTPDGICEYPSPGYKNGEDGMIEYICSRRGLVINEVLTSNSRICEKNGGYYDMIELFNDSEEPVSLAGYLLSDKISEPERFALPDITLEPFGYYVVYCAGEQNDTGYASFSLSRSGENIVLSRSDGYICDIISVPELTHDISYGRSLGDLVYFAAPTFGKANGEGHRHISSRPEANAESGIYTGDVKVSLSGDGDIFYTTDGSSPSVYGVKYGGEELIFDKPTTLRTVCRKGDLIESPEVVYNYLVNIPDLSLPVISVNADNEALYGENGVWNTLKKTELAGHVAYYKDGIEQFSVGCGVKLFGNGSVKYPKKSLQLKFKTKYDAPKLEYDIFEDGEIVSFDSLVVRAGAQGMYRALINDEFVSSLVSESGNMPSLLVQKYRPVNLYLNGEYMGVYFLREKIDEDFVSAHTGFSPESVTVMFRLKTLECGPDRQDWNEVIEYIGNHDMRRDENYEYFNEHFELENVVDWILTEIWCGNIDTLNVRVWRSSEGDGRWRFILYDLDRAFYYNHSAANLYLQAYRLTVRPYTGLIYKLLQNDTFRAYFYERLDFHMKNTFDPERSVEHFNALLELIDRDMPYEIERWKNEDSGRYKTYERWVGICETVKSRFTTGYLDAMLSDINTNVKKILADRSVNNYKR